MGSGAADAGGAGPAAAAADVDAGADAGAGPIGVGSAAAAGAAAAAANVTTAVAAAAGVDIGGDSDAAAAFDDVCPFVILVVEAAEAVVLTWGRVRIPPSFSTASTPSSYLITRSTSPEPLRAVALLTTVPAYQPFGSSHMISTR